MNKILIPIALFALILSSCEKTAKIRVKNLVHNAALESISFDDYSIGYSLYPGETAPKTLISDEKSDWPKTAPIEFFMIRDNNRVYLKTRYGFTLDADDDLLVIIADTTEVVSPFGKKTATLGDFME